MPGVVTGIISVTCHG